jgi:hypothetical protein
VIVIIRYLATTGSSMLQTVQTLTLSDVHIVGRQQLHTSRHQVAAEVEQLCARYGLRSTGYDNYATMAFYLFPHTSTARLTALNLMMNVLYFIDDEVNIENMEREDLSAREMFVNCMRLFRTGRMPTRYLPFYAVWIELHRRFTELTGQETLDRLVNSLGEYLKVSTCAEDVLYVNGALNLERFIELRLHLSGMYTVLDTMEFALDLHLPEEVLASDLLTQARNHCAFYGAMLNDIFSFHKEHLAGNKFNMVAVLMECYGISVDEAVHEVVVMLNERAFAFEALQTRYMDFGSASLNAQVRRYMSGLEDVFAASWYWQISTNRYRSPDSVIPELRAVLAAS